MPRQYFNNAGSTLAANIGTGATSIEVQAGHGPRFGTPSVADPVRLTLEQGTTMEIVEATARTGDVLTVTRAVEVVRPDTVATAYAFTSGALAQVRNTAASYSGGGGNAFDGGLRTSALDVYQPLLAVSLMAGTANLARTLNRLELYPILVSETIALKALGGWLQTVDGTNPSAVMRYGLWNHDAVNERPSTLIVDGGTVSVHSGVGRWIEVPISATLQPGIYWVGSCAQGSANVAQLNATSTNLVVHRVPIRRTAAPSQQHFPDLACVQYTGISGAFANITTDPTGQGGNVHIVWGRHA